MSDAKVRTFSKQEKGKRSTPIILINIKCRRACGKRVQTLFVPSRQNKEALRNGGKAMSGKWLSPTLPHPLLQEKKLKEMSKIKARISKLLQQLQEGIYEKEAETSLALLAALAGESILLLGPPGVAKSMVARRLKAAFKGARSFEYLMSRFSTPDEIFGPVSIARLKTDDRYERATDGYLPTADVVFLDEIWKAGPAIQNTLLTVMNEKLFRNGEHEERVPLKLLVAASNELPAKGEGLEALWDRFLIRIVCHCIGDEPTFRKMLADTGGDDCFPDKKETSCAIAPEEYATWQEKARKLPLSSALFEAITYVRERLQRVEVEGSELARRIYVSDRRWRHIAMLLRVSAYVQGRGEAAEEDLWPLYHCLWNEPDETDEVRRITLHAIFAPLTKRLDDLSAAVKADLRACNAQAALLKAKREHDHRDDALLITDRFFYQVENHGTGHTFIFITDYKKLPEYVLGRIGGPPARGILYPDTSNPQRHILRTCTPDWMNKLEARGTEQVTLARANGLIYINGVKYKMREKGTENLNPATGRVEDAGLFENEAFSETDSAALSPATSLHYEEQVEDFVADFESLCDRLDANIFASEEDRQAVSSHRKATHKQIALLRADIRRLLYDED